MSSKATTTTTTPFSITRSLDGSDLVNNNINNPSPLPFIFIPVNNMYMKALVDTGATHTFIHQDALNNIRHKGVYPAQQSYHLADGASSLSIIGYVDLEIRIQHVKTYVRAAVAKSLSCPLILGQDWITYYHVDYNSLTNRLSIYNNTASVSIERVDETTFPVRLVQQIVLEPKSEHVVEAHVPISSTSAVLFYPNQRINQIKSIIIPHSLLHVNKYITKLTIYNPNVYSCRLPANTHVGTITSLLSSDKILNFIDNNNDTTITLPCKNYCKCQQHVNQYVYSDLDRLGSYGDYDNCYYQQYISPISGQQKSNTSKCINMMTDTNTNNVTTHVFTVIQEAIQHIINRPQQQQLYEILHKYYKIFDTSSPTIASTTIPHTIRTADNPPMNSRPYRGSEEQQHALRNILKIMSATNQIRPSTSPWSSPVLLVKKKDGDYRFVVDYRKLNSVTVKDSFPIPIIEATLKQLSGHSYFTKLDLKSGYFQIPIQEEDKHKTAFITTTGLWEFNVLPQGLKNAPPSFQRIMYNLLVNKREHYCLVYLDDIIIFSKSFTEHIKHLDATLSTLYEHNFQLNPSKCLFVKQQIDYLGHTIDICGMKPLHDNIKAIKELPLPHEPTLKQANEFIGGIGWYRKFIKDFAKIAAPIHSVTNLNKNKQHKFYWGKEQRDAANKLKQIVSGPDLVLEFPDPTGLYVLSTDASNNGLGGVLKQITTCGKLKILYYLSRKLSPSESKYSTTEKEALAMVWCIDRLRSYLLGVDFKVETDHCPLCNIHKKKSRNGRIERWIVGVLQEYNIIEIKYKKGKCHCDADLLSRYPQLNINDDPDIIFRKQDHGYLFPHIDVDDDNGLHNCTSSAIVNVITRSKTKINVLDPTSSLFSSTNISNEPSLSLEANTETTKIPHIDLTLKWIKQEQKLDTTIQNIITHMKNNDNPRYVMIDDVLYRLIPRGTQNIRLPYLPPSLIKDVLFLFHDHPTSAHFGINRTYEKLKNKYYWPKMKSSIVNYIQSCLQCSKHNIRRTKPPGLMHSTELPNEVLGIVGMDYWGPTNEESLHGNRYVITMTDYLSKFVFAKPVPTNTAEEASKFFYEIVCQFGPPAKLITDNGSHFISELSEAVIQQCNTTHVLTTPYHPMSNGQTERFNATFAPSLAKLFDKKRQDWDIYLQSCVYAYNTGKHATTGMSPYQLMFGREPQPLMDRKQLKVRLSKPNVYWDAIKQSRLLFQQIATTNAQHQNWLTKQRYDKNRPNPQYEIGELVLIKVLDKLSKLQEQFEGPYRIIKQKGPSTFVVKIENPEEDDNPDYTKQVTTCDMKPIITRNI
jgi:hypothetical protein